ncbi:rhodanese [Seonamhaeicola sp. S2-3]|uniref:rhodanese-like domain-containing protein n=1 Tax=Seonamhaeicola sp. S2-3 TaxID=1936081 RepID=UPI0009726FA7|nr:rhodanese-like domain-containing protein [Seonamhaeicola sp. S2-3]APY11392.1 rhodanese [Seonamhaeicola sp. S2-3]
MQKNILILFIFSSVFGFSQKKLAKLLKKHNSENIPYIYVEELQLNPTNIIFLDAREENEYAVSHLKDAILVGYNFFNIDSTRQKITNKDSKIVVYCSLGIRSENIALKLKKAGYTNVFNLFGGIFEWKNNGNPIYNSKGFETNKIHAFSKEWGKWLKQGEKVYD